MISTKNNHVFILEDQTSCLNRLTRLVESTLSVASMSVARDLAQVYEMNTSDCHLGFIDIQLPDGQSFEFIAHHLKTHPDIPLIVTTFYDDDESAFKALSLGVSGYLLKSDNDDLLSHALKSILMGQIPMSPYIAKRLMDQVQVPKTSGASSVIEELSEREQEVLKLISRGLLTKQVAFELNLSPHTVNDVIKRIYRKCNIKNRIEAQEFAIQNHLI